MTPILTSCAKGTAAMMAPAWRETRPAGPQRRRGRANGTARVPQAALLKDCPATSSSSLLLCHLDVPRLPPKRLRKKWRCGSHPSFSRNDQAGSVRACRLEPVGTMGGGSSVMVSDLELYDRDPANPDDDPEELKQLDSDLRKGIYIHCSRAVTELRLPFNGRYLIYVRGAKGMGRDKDPHQQAGGGWDTFDGGGGACLEAEFDLTNQHTLSFLVGSAGSQQGCGGGGSFVAYRLVEQQGWDVKHRRPRFAKFVVPGEDVREVGKPFLMSEVLVKGGSCVC